MPSADQPSAPPDCESVDEPDVTKKIARLRARVESAERAERLAVVRSRRQQSERWRQEREAAEAARRAAAAEKLAALEEEEAAFAARLAQTTCLDDTQERMRSWTQQQLTATVAL